ncbi:SDR family NAD(P)-dependent oxidoreductase [Sphingobium sp. Z007]|uniref:SDR family NAD(P)-dependent oxidoreductase n=1 Tax=Sphingobium sp. Z007 TaxID=627495 RepID=UPI000B49DB2D|nr:SDR family NAD(P)-dependent oxidoreductase [Sphingobium sp. Z007]
MSNLAGKVALVTGGTSGIGKATVERLSADGAHVIFTGSNEAAAAAITAATGATFLKSRVQEPADWARFDALVRADFGRLDIAFANAGMERGDSSVEHIALDAWNGLLDVNLTGVMLTAQAAVRLMRDNPGGATGSIIVNSSMSAHKVMGNFVAYSTTKGAVLALSKSVAMHCANEGMKIRCNAILPGVVQTDMIQAIIDKSPDSAAALAAYQGMSPLRRMAQVEEVAALVSFLASDEAAFISGAEYAIDGASTAGMMGV